MSTGNELVTLKQVDNYYKDLRKRSAPVIFNNAVGNPAVFSDGADGLPIQSLKVHLLPRQEGTGDPSPQNIRSIIPWNGFTVWNGGVNVWDEQWEVGTINTTTGEPAQADDRIRAKNYCPCLPNTTYYVVDPTHGKNIRLFYYDQSKAYIGDSAWKDSEVTTPAGAYFFRFIVAASYGTTYNNNISINYPASITAYEPYHPITETDIDFLSPVYGGTLDVVSGVLTVEYVITTLNGSESWYLREDQTYGDTFYIETNGKKAERGKSVCDAFANITDCWGASGQGKYGVFSDHHTLPWTFFRPPNNSITTLNELKAWLAENPIHLAYALAVPQEITLTSEQITALKGENTIWSDANGDIEVEYRADTGLFLKQNTVKDVQVNGSSVLTDGVANVPLMTTSTPGVAMRGPGLYISDGTLGVNTSSSTDIKGGLTGTLTQVSKQHEATFYGLAKAAGADMAQSSNPVGQFTDEAKIAIQKMLGVYEAPWELIREDTVTNATEENIDITVDGNGNQLELTDIAIIFELPKNNDPASKGDYGRIYYYYGDGGYYILTEHGLMTRNADGNAVGILGLVEQKNGMVFATRSQPATSTNTGNLGWRFHASIERSNAFFIPSSQLVFNKLRISYVTGTGHYKLYGKRKWN